MSAGLFDVKFPCGAFLLPYKHLTEPWQNKCDPKASRSIVAT